MLIHTHVHKAAGNTIKSILKETFGHAFLAMGKGLHEFFTEKRLAAISPFYDPVRLQAISSPSINVTQAHRHFPGSMTILFLRSPKERVMSLYHHIKRRKEVPGFHPYYYLKDEVIPTSSVLEFLASYEQTIPRISPTNYQCLGRDRMIKEIEETEILGFTERFPESLALMEIASGRRFDYPPSLSVNVNPQNPGSGGYCTQISQEEDDLLSEITAQERQAYQHALSVFDHRLRAAGHGAVLLRGLQITSQRLLTDKEKDTCLRKWEYICSLRPRRIAAVTGTAEEVVALLGVLQQSSAGETEYACLEEPLVHTIGTATVLDRRELLSRGVDLLIALRCPSAATGIATVGLLDQHI